MHIIFAILCLILIRLPAYSEDPPIVLQTQLHPPYQVMSGSHLSGPIPDTLRCIFNELRRSYVISLAPTKRNRKLLQTNRIDGFFLSIPDEKLDKTAIPTKPLALERWKYFRLKDSPLPDFPDDHLVGAVLGSNEAVWLEQEGKNTSRVIPNIKSLVKLLERKRIPFALADENVFKATSEQTGARLEDMSSTFVRYVPLVAYFSKSFVSHNPDFIDNFNASLDLCVNDVRTTHASEANYLLDLTYNTLGTHKKNLLQDLHTSASNKMPVAQKYIEDSKWKEAIQNAQSTPLMKQILANETSIRLKEITARDSAISEMFLMDNQGFIVGMNHPTSDYWQGDEQAFISLTTGQDHYVSKILFDHSTHKFQIQVSVPLKAAGSQQIIGILTIGYDAEKALAAQTM